MKKLKSIFGAFALLVFLCACGGEDAPSEQDSSKKGTIENPYLLSEIIEFTAYQIENYDFLTDIRTVCLPSTFRISNLEIHDNTVEETDATYKLLSFTIEIIESSVNTPINFALDYSLNFQNINTNGVVGGTAYFPYGMEETLNLRDFSILSVLPGFATEAGIILHNTNDGGISLISLKYCDKDGELIEIYISPDN